MLRKNTKFLKQLTTNDDVKERKRERKTKKLKQHYHNNKINNQKGSRSTLSVKTHQLPRRLFGE